jgi:hypothetical protein
VGAANRTSSQALRNRHRRLGKQTITGISSSIARGIDREAHNCQSRNISIVQTCRQTSAAPVQKESERSP